MSVLNFTLAPELEDLRLRAAKVAAEGVENFGRFTDSWMNGVFIRIFTNDGIRRLDWHELA